MESLQNKIMIKAEYDFYYYVVSYHTEYDWKRFSDTLENLPDVAEELEELKKETKRRLNGEQNTEEYLGNITVCILELSVVCPSILAKIVHYMSNHYFSHYIPRYIKDLATYDFIVEEIRLIKYQIQLYCFFRFAKELAEQAENQNTVLNSIYSATELCLKESKNRELWVPLFNQYVDTLIPLFSILKENHPHEYAEFQQFFSMKWY